MKNFADCLADAWALWHHLDMSIQHSPTYNSKSYDVIIVGSGPTGSLVAHRMATEGLSVLILEAGQRFGGHHALSNSEGNAEQDHVVGASQLPGFRFCDSESWHGSWWWHTAVASRDAAIPSRRFSHIFRPKALGTIGRSAMTTCDRTTADRTRFWCCW